MRILRVENVTELPLGGSMEMVFESDDDVSAAALDVTSPCWDSATLTLIDLPLPVGQTTISVPLPWHVLLTGTPCSEYQFSLYRSRAPQHADTHRVFVSPVSVPPSRCARAGFVTSPVDGEIIVTTAPYTFRWNPHQLFRFEPSSLVGIGVMRKIEAVTIILTGFLPDGSSSRFDEVVITQPEGIENSGEFLFDFSSGLDGNGNPLAWGPSWIGRFEYLTLRITASNHYQISGSLVLRLALCAHLFMQRFKCMHYPAAGLSTGRFRIQSSLSKQIPFCSPHQPSNTASAIPTVAERNKNAEHSLQLRKTATLTLDTGYGMVVGADFQAVNIYAVGVGTFNLWKSRLAKLAVTACRQTFVDLSQETLFDASPSTAPQIFQPQ